MLDVDTLYVVGDSYARTPDGEGCYWYDESQYEDAAHDVSDYVRIMHFESARDFDRYRFGTD